MKNLNKPTENKMKVEKETEVDKENMGPAEFEKALSEFKNGKAGVDNITGEYRKRR